MQIRSGRASENFHPLHPFYPTKYSILHLFLKFSARFKADALRHFNNVQFVT